MLELKAVGVSSISKITSVLERFDPPFYPMVQSLDLVVVCSGPVCSAWSVRFNQEALTGAVQHHFLCCCKRQTWVFIHRGLCVLADKRHRSLKCRLNTQTIKLHFLCNTINVNVSLFHLDLRMSSKALLLGVVIVFHILFCLQSLQLMGTKANGSYETIETWTIPLN